MRTSKIFLTIYKILNTSKFQPLDSISYFRDFKCFEGTIGEHCVVEVRQEFEYIISKYQKVTKFEEISRTEKIET